MLLTIQAYFLSQLDLAKLKTRVPEVRL